MATKKTYLKVIVDRILKENGLKREQIFSLKWSNGIIYRKQNRFNNYDELESLVKDRDTGLPYYRVETFTFFSVLRGDLTITPFEEEEE